MLKFKFLTRARKLVDIRPYLVFIGPSFVGIMIFFAVPYIDVFRRAFFSSTGKTFVGVDNFIKVFTNDAFILATKNTALFIFSCIPTLLIISLVISVYIYNHTIVGNYFKTCFLVPMAIPIAAVVLIWRIMFDKYGFINMFLDIVGVDSIDWMNTNYAFCVLVISYIWKNLGYHIVLWLAGLSMIPVNVYEAAKLDGAGGKTIFFKITLPNLLPMIYIIVVLALINSFKVFREAYLVAGNYPHESMYMVQHLFNNWFRELALDKMAAGSFLISIVLMVLIFILKKAWENEK